MIAYWLLEFNRLSETAWSESTRSHIPKRKVTVEILVSVSLCKLYATKLYLMSHLTVKYSRYYQVLWGMHLSIVTIILRERREGGRKKGRGK